MFSDVPYNSPGCPKGKSAPIAGVRCAALRWALTGRGGEAGNGNLHGIAPAPDVLLALEVQVLVLPL